MTKNKTNLKNGVWYLLAFTLPLLIMLFILLIKGIFWGSDKTILASDGFHQYVIFSTRLRDALHGDGSLFYTFTSGIGLNFYALISYYLGSFLSPFVFFFNLESMPDALYIFTLIKFGLIGLSTFFSLHKIYNKLTPFFLLTLSSAFSLMSFAVSQLEINMWLDVFILAPLIILGLHRLVTGQGRVLYYISLTTLFIQNYYFGYMMAIFLALYYLVQLSWDFKQRVRTLLDFIVVSLLSALTSLVMILPTLLDLRTHGETLTKISQLQTEDSWWLDLFAKNLVGSYDTTKFGAIPMIYVGIIPLILTLLFFTLRSIKWQVKVSYFLFLVLMIASFYLQPLDLFWQGMHAPNMFLHRYSWLFSLLLILMAAESLTRLRELSLKQLLFPFAFLILGGCLTYLYRQHYSFLASINFLISLEFLVAYFIISVLYIAKKISFHHLAIAIFCFSLFEIGLNSHYQVNGLSEEWNFPSRQNYSQDMGEITSLVKTAKGNETDFFRLERLNAQTGNDSMKYNYNGISQFSSIRNTASSSTLDKLGFRSDGTNLNLRYHNNTILMDAIFGIRYNIADVMPSKYGFTKESTSNGLSLYRNVNSSSLAIMTEGVYKDVELTNLTLDNQTQFVNQLTGLDLNYFTKLTSPISTNTINTDDRVTVKKDVNYPESKFASATYTFNVNEDSQVYLSLPNLSFSNDNQKSIQILVDNTLYNYSIDNAFSFFNLGTFNSGQVVTIRLLFPDNHQVSFDNPQFYGLQLENFQTAINHINSKTVATRVSGNQVETTYTAETDTSLIYTIPFDHGWTATVNGKPVAIKAAQKGFIQIDIPKGEGAVTLSFTPNGFKSGLYFFFGGIVLFFLYEMLQMYKAGKKEVEQ